MTRFCEIKNETERMSKLNYVKEIWTGWRKARETTLARINNYLFTLNTGALLASLTYVAAKQNSADITLSIWVFAIGILFSVLHAVIDYYSVEKYFTDYRANVKSLYDNEMDWEDFITKSPVSSKLLDRILHSIGWASGLSFIVAFINGVIHLK